MNKLKLIAPLAALSALALVSCGEAQTNGSTGSSVIESSEAASTSTPATATSTTAPVAASSTAAPAAASSTATPAAASSTATPAAASSTATPVAASSSTVTVPVATYDDTNLEEHTLYIVGDSTVCEYNPLDFAYYPRYGYGTQISNFLSSKISVVNLALSGRSSRSFLSEGNYNTLKTSIKSGDFLMIGFGHNDEKNEEGKFTDATLPTTDSASFKYSLYENYVKLAKDAGATPILCSPIVRLDPNDDYTGSSAHITSTGDYGKAVIELAEEKNVDYVDLTTITKNDYTALGYDEAIYYHCINLATDESLATPNLNSVDKTHVNIYGAKMLSYEIADAIVDTDCKLAPYINTDKLVKPTKAKDLVIDSNYYFIPYETPNLANYEAPERFMSYTEGWYGTAFGNMGGNSTSPFNAKELTETVDGKEVPTSTYLVSSTSLKGKFESKGDGMAYFFTQLASTKTFEFTATAVVNTPVGDKQGGFGLMLRDDCFINVELKNETLSSNHAAAGFITSSATSANINFERRNGSIIKGEDTITNPTSSFDKDGNLTTKYVFKIVRSGQDVSCTTTIVDATGKTADKKYTTVFKDNIYNKVDGSYIYLGMFANRSASVTFSDVTLNITGDYITA